MNEMFVMYANYKKKSSHKRKVAANLEKNVCAYFKIKNILGMFEGWCDIKPKYFKFRTLNAHKQLFNSKYFNWLGYGILR